MAIVNGTIYPELHNRLYGHRNLNILVVENQAIHNAIQKHLETLQAYIQNARPDLSLKLSFADSVEKDTINDKLMEEDIDILLVNAGVFTTREGTTLKYYIIQKPPWMK